MEDLREIKAQKPLVTTSLVDPAGAADPALAANHFSGKLALETDPSDVHSDLMAGHSGFVVLDTRPTEAYESAHVPGAISMPYRTIDELMTRKLGQDELIVVYCWGPACNGAAKGAVRLATLGYRVKEMVGGIEYWRREGYPIARGSDPGSITA